MEEGPVNREKTLNRIAIYLLFSIGRCKVNGLKFLFRIYSQRLKLEFGEEVVFEIWGRSHIKLLMLASL